MKAVILESYVMEPGDLDWSGVKALVPDTVSYVRTAYEEIAPRIGDADLVLLNKCRIDENILAQCPNLKWVGIIATGTDNLDLEACCRHGVAVANVPGYSTYSVAQMTFSLLLAICQCAERYNRAMKAGPRNCTSSATPQPTSWHRPSSACTRRRTLPSAPPPRTASTTTSIWATRS